jgi:hypothetical protein
VNAMGELIKTNMLTYAFVMVFVCLLVSEVVYGVFKKTKNIDSKKIKTVLRFGISGALVCLWAWFFVYKNFYPISLAYYEYNHNLVEEKIGVIERIEQNGKDRISISIDNTEYTVVHSSVNPLFVIGKDIDEGDTVKIEYGEKSRFVFDIHEISKSS